jgi:uncharacterized protein
MSHPCLTCGACCAYFRVSFHWSEADPELGGTVPIALTEPLRQHERAMRGTSQPQPRCVALDAEIGVYSRCSIHPVRPSVCRAVPASWDPDEGEHAQPSAQCDKARIAHGLMPLTRTDWMDMVAVDRAPAVIDMRGHGEPVESSGAESSGM